MQADYAKPLAETQTRRFSETTALTKQWFQSPWCYRDPQRTTASSKEGVLGGRSPVGITSTGGGAWNEAHEDVWCDREACKA
ncbi:hypothetical protein GCM10010403_31330 [Glycomyces rutgersensis]|uniref:Uncharacterized protein n=1 Tax=Glycomyces rutgersensis TaxID=58115 RepID=A0ABN3FSW9_9ACTN